MTRARISWRTDEAEPGVTPQLRYDRGSLLSAKRREDGILLVEGYAARPGVYVYRNADGSERRELVPLSTLKDHARTLGRSTLTLHHPGKEHGHKVDEDSYKDLSVGDVDGEVVIEDDGYVRVKLAVRRRDAIEAVESGSVRELSPGYQVQLDETPGVDPDFGPYDAVQVKRWGNHLALVANARGGTGCHVRVDGDPRSTTGPESGHQPKGPTMLTKLIALLATHGMSVRSDSEEAALADLAVGLKGLKQDADTIRTDGETKANQLQADLDAEKKRADDAEARVTELEAEVQKRDDDAELERLTKVAAKHNIDAKGLDLKALRIAIAQTQVGESTKLDGKADAYIDALVDRADSAEAAGADPWKGTPRTDSKRRADGAEPLHKPISSTSFNSYAGGDA